LFQPERESVRDALFKIVPHGQNQKYDTEALQSLMHNSGRYVHYEEYEGGWGAEAWLEGRAVGTLLPQLREAAQVRVLIVDERLDESMERTTTAPTKLLTARGSWYGKGIRVVGREYQGSDVPSEKNLLEVIKAERPEFVIVHHGILDKIYKKHHSMLREKKEWFSEVARQMRVAGAWQTLIHSGRAGDLGGLPHGTKFIHLSNIEAWFSGKASKMDVLEELMSVRRSEK
jgi:hypothetical protein